MAAKNLKDVCPIRGVLDRVGDQWSFLVLDLLRRKVMRFNELLRAIGDISRQMLSKTLKRLDEDGYITRTLYPEVPPRVEYALTDLGRSFMEPMQALVAWADMHHQQIKTARSTVQAA